MQGYFNLGDAMYKQKRHDEAIQNYETALTKTKDLDIASRLYHNIGNSYFEGKKYAESIDAYKRALRASPKDEDTRYNLAYAQRMLRQQQQQQNKQDKNNKNDKKKDQDQKDKDKQQQQNKQDQQKNQDQRKNQAQNRQQEKQMSKPEAQRILDALKNDEKDIQKKLRKRAAVRLNVEKDW
jgi:tetratricopeptide (TPR) repeat protein